MQSMIKVLLVDDHNLFSKLLESHFKSFDEIEVVGILYDGSQVKNFIENNEVDVILLDIDMPEKDGITTLKEIKKVKKCPKIIMLSNHIQPEYIKRTFDNGALGYLTKYCLSNEIVKAVKEVNKGKKYFSTDLIQSGIIDKLKELDDSLYNKLTTRELEIIRFICEGKTSREIAEKLCISIRTVETHRKNIFSKLDVKNTASMIKKAQELGLCNSAQQNFYSPIS